MNSNKSLMIRYHLHFAHIQTVTCERLSELPKVVRLEKSRAQPLKE